MPRLTKEFYQRKEVLKIAQELLGKILVSKIDGKTCSAKIVETEAYRAPDDVGCHATKHGVTARTKTMYMAGGHCYVYMCYGIHPLFNVVTGLEGMAHAVLVRGVEPISGIDIMESRRTVKGPKKLIYNGPGKFTRAMGITTKHDAIDMMKKGSKLYIEDASSISKAETLVGPRVGMGAIGKWKHVPWRFRIKDNIYTSKPDVVVYE